MPHHKKNKPAKQQQKNSVPVKSNGPSFIVFIFKNKENRYYLLAGLGIAIVYFIVLKILFPAPFLPVLDSYQYVDAAKNNAMISYRPLGYSEFIKFFHNISPTGNTLILGQYFINATGGLFLFFSLAFFFNINKVLRIMLFVVLAANPLTALYCNYILSESFFHGFVILWLSLLLWLMYRPRWYIFALQAVTFIFLFKLRYNALFFPLFIALALLISKQHIAKKLLYVTITAVSIYIMVYNTREATFRVTNQRVFSAFGGWMLANNAMFALKHIHPDTSAFSNPVDKDICLFAEKYFSENKNVPDTINAFYMWNTKAPLKQYLFKYELRNRITVYFNAWVALAPVYSNFARAVIMKFPLAYLQYFCLPNAKAYWVPLLEAYGAGYLSKDYIGPAAVQYYKGMPAKNVVSHLWVVRYIMKGEALLFPIVNAVFLLLVIIYFCGRFYKRNNLFGVIAIGFYTLYYLFNFSFSVMAAPITFRYNISILTLCPAFIILMVHFIFIQKTKTAVKPVISGK